MPYDQLLAHRRSMPMASYHLTLCTCGRLSLFSEPAAAAVATMALRRTADLGHSVNHAWVLMPDHLHWLMSTTDQRTLPQVVAGFKANASQVLSRSGLVATSPWQAGYYEHRLRNDEDLRQQARYLIANPLRAGLVKQLADYPWWYAQWAHPPHGPVANRANGEDLLMD